MQDYRTRRAARSALLKRQTLLKWIAGFTVTIAATVVSAFVPAAAAEATFLSVSAAGTDIAYEAYVDASLDESGDAAIRVVARDQFGDREQTVFAGRSSGVFTGLKADTEYRLLIEIDSGFGWRTLARTTVTTDPGPGGAIVGYAVEEVGGYQWETFLAYAVSIHVADPEGMFASVTFRHAYLYRSEVCEDADPVACAAAGKMLEPPVDRWISVPVAGSDQTVELPSLWKDEYRFFWILEAMTTSGETVTLDQRTFDSAPVFYAYLSVYDAGVDWLAVSAHVEQNARVDASFEAVVSTPAGEFVSRYGVTPSSGEQSYDESGTHRVDRLLRETEYHLELFATYVDPTTGYSVTAVVAGAHGWTTPYYAGSCVWSETDAGFDFTAAYDDPDGILGPIRYYVSIWQTDQYVFYDSGMVDLTVDGDARTASFSIPKPGTHYRITVYLDKTPVAGTIYTEILADIERTPA